MKVSFILFINFINFKNIMCKIIIERSCLKEFCRFLKYRLIDEKYRKIIINFHLIIYEAREAI